MKIGTNKYTEIGMIHTLLELEKEFNKKSEVFKGWNLIDVSSVIKILNQYFEENNLHIFEKSEE